jgi:ATP-dependent DNA helicase RecQ
LKALKTLYPGVAIHAYTATATELVRNDILQQLGLENARVLVGSMDRPNLNYQIRRRQNGIDQIVDVINQHKGESGIVYCISRKNVEDMCAALGALGFSALPYHAGMSSHDRKKNQEAFLREEIDIIIATVAFGMGIDKSNVRFVIHAAMPKSLEAYQQESGRAGRDGLDAECWLFFNGGDYVTWKRLIDQSESPSGREGALEALKAIGNFTNSIQCRHVALAAHFGETLNSKNCGACDVCLDDLDLVEQPLVLAQKIISCVYRVDQRFGADYVSQILARSRDKRILQNGHEKLSTYGLLATENRKDIRTWIEQLTGQGFLIKTGEYNVLQITDSGRELLRGNAEPRLTKSVEGNESVPKSSSSASWAGVDQDLFEKLRVLRGREASARQLPAYVVFSDASLRDMARRRPSTLDAFRLLHGVGQQRLDDYGQQFLDLIRQHCETNQLETDVQPSLSADDPSAAVTRKPSLPTASATASFAYFDQDLSIEDVAAKLGRAESTTRGYLVQYIQHKKITDARRWVAPETIERITTAANRVGCDALKPIFVALDEQVNYNDIRIVVTCLNNVGQ